MMNEEKRIQEITLRLKATENLFGLIISRISVIDSLFSEEEITINQVREIRYYFNRITHEAKEGITFINKVERLISNE